MSIGIGIGIPFRKAAFSWEDYWATRTDLFLFFGQTENISGGQLLNEMDGSTDALTVTGIPGSYTFQCPNNAIYIAADTDYIWFKTDASQRTTTEAELVGYDLPRTPVKYDDADPYTIRWIAILKNGVVLTATELDNLHSSFHLPLFWSGVLNINGYLKGNRGLVQQPWTPESVYDVDLVTYISGLETELSEGQLDKINTFIGTLKTGLSSDNLSDDFDCLWYFGNETSECSLRNMVRRAHDSTLHGTFNNPVFTALEGFAGGVSNECYINTHYNPHDEGVNYTLNNASFLIYSRTARIQDTGKIHGAKDATAEIRLAIRRDATVMRIALNTAVGVYSIATVADSLGMHGVVRSASNAERGTKNGILLVADNEASLAIPDLDNFLLAQNVSGTPTYFDDIQISFASFGRYFSEAELTVIFNAFEALMDANGKGVVV